MEDLVEVVEIVNMKNFYVGTFINKTLVKMEELPLIEIYEKFKDCFSDKNKEKLEILIYKEK